MYFLPNLVVPLKAGGFLAMRATTNLSSRCSTPEGRLMELHIKKSITTVNSQAEGAGRNCLTVDSLQELTCVANRSLLHSDAVSRSASQ